MVAATFDFKTLLPILPEIGLVMLIALVLILDLAVRGDKKRWLAWVTIAGLAVVAACSVIIGVGQGFFAQPPTAGVSILGGMLRLDSTVNIFRLVFFAGAAITALFAVDTPVLGERGEFYLLLLVATLGMCLMSGAANLIMIYLAIETTSIPLYVLAGFMVRDEKSTEAGLKYLLYGAISSAVMLYGFSLIYGFTGTTDIYQIASLIQGAQLSPAIIAGLAMLVLTGLAFKIAAVPLQFWAPDVYQGAPTPVAGFLSTASKAAGFVVLMRLYVAVFSGTFTDWKIVLAVLATLSMLVGNILALTQKNIKRLLAYSSIAQAGYILIGLTAGSNLGFSGAIYYLMVYLVTNLAAFGVVAVVGRATGSDELSAYNGLSRRSPGLALILLVALLSLGGIPPFGGFVVKLLVFASAIQQPALVWLGFVGILNSVIALYYYLTVLKMVYLNRSEVEDQKIPVTIPWGVALGVCVIGILVLGTILAPWLNASLDALRGLI